MAYLGTKPANQVIDSTLIADGTVTPADLSTGKPVWDTNGNLVSSGRVQVGVLGQTNSAHGLTIAPVTASQAVWNLAAIEQCLTFRHGDNTTQTNNTEILRINNNGKITASAGTNWVGAVSQSGNSAIIERGSNASGEYVRFADGTMIVKSATHLASSLTRDLTLPIAFTGSFGEAHVSACTIPFTSAAAGFMVTNVYLSAADTVKCTWGATSSNQTFFLVVGRWY